MQLEIEATLDYFIDGEADVLLQVEVAQMVDQRLIEDRLMVGSPEKLRPVAGEETVGQRTWARGSGRFDVTYTARVEIDRQGHDLAGLAASDPRSLPGLVVPYLMPSRYIESDRLQSFVNKQFGDREGGDKVLAMLDWFAGEIEYVGGISDQLTTAAMTFVERRGVCRDYAHLLAAFARAAGIPARMVSGYAPRVTPPDFHAVVELWLADGWRMVDATGMAKPHELARIAIGRDATDIAFMTVFGAATLNAQSVRVGAIG